MRVKCVAHVVAEYIEGKNRKKNSSAGADDEPRLHAEVVERVVEHPTPVRRAPGQAQSEERESREEQHRVTGGERRLDDERVERVGEDVAEHDTQVGGA